MEDCKPMTTPIATHLSSFLSLEIIKEKENMLGVLYVNAVGSIMYAMFYTYPSILHVSVINKFMRNFGKVNYRPWNAYYLRGTKYISLCMTLVVALYIMLRAM